MSSTPQDLGSRAARRHGAMRAAQSTEPSVTETLVHVSNRLRSAGIEAPRRAVGSTTGEAANELTEFTLHGLARARDESERRAFSDAVLALQPLSLRLHMDAVRLRSDRMGTITAALTRLRHAGTVDSVISSICAETVCAGGFHRAVLSHVNTDTWNPWDSFARDSGQLGSWLEDWIGAPIPLRERSPERLSIARRIPTVVSDTGTAQVYRPIIVEAGASSSYVVAPVFAGDRVVGLIHADHAPDGALVDETDRDALWALATGVGLVYERTQLNQALRSQRDLTREILLAAADDIMAAIDRIPAEPMPRYGISELDDLTPRESEVLALMAEGATNHDISDRLVISGDTVKSHVKHILRKLSAQNRAQAVTIYLHD
ncbi:LuxR C-terminal-related transcriptional regulator [soil metagenome]